MTTDLPSYTFEKTFAEWFAANLSESAADIANHGADGGFPCITYNADCAAIFDRYADEIWNMANEMADDMGERNVAAMIAGFQRADMLTSIDGFKTLMVWFACEETARNMIGED